ncbi:MAG TPA: SCO family protein [Vicinamibacterales bacterium]|nr:SCO family protein [Vicinamibacterales bacterium]
MSERRRGGGWFAAALLLVTVPFAVTAAEYPVTGMVLKVDRSRNTFVASIQAIPGFMPAMAMPFEVRYSKDLEGLVPGAAVEFTFIVNGNSSYAERIRIVRYQSVEQDPLAASRLKLLTQIAGTNREKVLAIGDMVPDFRLIDQKSRPLALSDLRGKVVAINFIYTSCPLPNFCLRIANNFGVLQKRLKARLGRDLVLLTVTFDPVHDTPAVLARYASQWDADPATWHFLTGPSNDVQRVCQLFGVDSFTDDGLMNHSLRTAIIDRRGAMVANIEGNRFTSDQLVDLTNAVLDSTNRR